MADVQQQIAQDEKKTDNSAAAAISDELHVSKDQARFILKVYGIISAMLAVTFGWSGFVYSS